MRKDLTLILREILNELERAGKSRPTPESVRRRLAEKGISDHLISDALFLLDVIGDVAAGKKESARPTRVLASEEIQGLNSGVVGKLFRLYYLGYMKKEEMETVMTNLLFVPPDIQDDRARQSVAAILGITPGQANFIFDGGLDSAVIH